MDEKRTIDKIEFALKCPICASIVNNDKQTTYQQIEKE